MKNQHCESKRQNGFVIRYSGNFARYYILDSLISVSLPEQQQGTRKRLMDRNTIVP